MSSSAQIAANRQHAKRSTGPRTPAGKAIAARNSTRHGLLAEAVLVGGEDEALFCDRLASLRADLKPFGGLQENRRQLQSQILRNEANFLRWSMTGHYSGDRCF